VEGVPAFVHVDVFPYATADKLAWDAAPPVTPDGNGNYPIPTPD